MENPTKTVNCIYCEKPATGFSGNVIKAPFIKVIAGYCDAHFDLSKIDVFGIEGCQGLWSEQMGEQKFTI